MNSNSTTETELEQRLFTAFPAADRVAVAMSAGVDSTLVAAAAQRLMPGRVVAVTAVSPSLPSGELAEAESLTRFIGIPHRAVSTEELNREGYVRNATDRCYFCKTELYGSLSRLAEELQFDVILNGANLDDCGDFRPGMRAATEFGVRSPLIEAGFGKLEVRQLARAWGLPNWNKAAGPCLSSRIAYGVEVTQERLARIDAAELWLRRELGVRELRVRCEANDLARIELPPSALPLVFTEATPSRIVDELKRLGFRYVTLDLEGFRSGSMNLVHSASLVELTIPPPISGE